MTPTDFEHPRLTSCSAPREASPCPVNATQSAQVDACVARVLERHGRLDSGAHCVDSLLLKPAHLTSAAPGRSARRVKWRESPLRRVRLRDPMAHRFGPEGVGAWVFVRLFSIGRPGDRTITTALRWSNPRGALQATMGSWKSP